MPSAQPFDRQQYREEIRRRLEVLGRKAILAFAARCAWRAAPWLITGWRDERKRRSWMIEHLENVQAALAVALIRSRGEGYDNSTDTFAFADADSAAFAAAAADAAFAASAAADAADAAAAAFAASAAVVAIDDADADTVADTAADAATFASADDNDNKYVLLRAIDADLAALSEEWNTERWMQQPLWTKHPPALEHLWAEWQDVISAVPTAGPFLEHMQRIHHGAQDWGRLRQMVDIWWSQSPANPGINKKMLVDSKKQMTAKVTRSKTRKKELEPPADKPTEPKTRRIIQHRLVSTTNVAADAEAETLTPTAQRCMLALREFLVSEETRPPLTVAVEAPWGGGKSSLMRHLQDALTNSEDKPISERPFNEEPIPTVWFNPWKHEAGKTLWAAFAVAFERQLAENHGFWRRHWTRVCLSVQRLEPMEKLQLALRFTFWIGAIVVLACIAWSQTHAEVVVDWKDRLMGHAPWLGMIVAMWAFLKDAVAQLGSPLKLDVSRLLTHNDHADKVDDLHRFHEDFRRLMRAYIPKRKNDQPGKVVVFIDDLDRCEAPKAAELLQSLHQMLNVQERGRSSNDKDAPGIICVLGMDREKVAAAVAAKHEKLLPLLMKTDAQGKVSQENAMVFGHEFLEKFIQLTLHLPPMQGRDLDDFLVSITGAKRTAAEASPSVPTLASQANAVGSGEHERTSRPPNEVFADLAAETVREQMEHKRAEERIERVSEDLDDGRIALQCARYVAPALENNPRKLKQFVNLFRLRLYLTAAMNFLDLPDRDAEKLDIDPLRRMAPGKLSVHHLAKLVALELAAPSEMAAIREKRTDRMFQALEAAFPADEKPLLNALVVSRDPFDPEGYDLSKAALDAYFHFFRAEVVKEQVVAE